MKVEHEREKLFGKLNIVGLLTTVFMLAAAVMV